MTKIVINRDYGGFGLSEKAMRRYAELKGLTLYPELDSYGLCTTYYTVPPEQREPEIRGQEWHKLSMEERAAYNERHRAYRIYDRDIARDDPLLVQVVEELKDQADDRFAALKVVEIPDDVEWEIEEYDGKEWIAEQHRTWG